MHNTSAPNVSPRAPQIALLFEPLKLYEVKKKLISSQVESFYTPDWCSWLSKNSDEITSIGHVPYIMFLLNDYLSTNFISKHFLLERYVHAWTLWYFTVTFIVNDVSVRECHQNVSSVCVKNEMKLFSIICKKQRNKPKKPVNVKTRSNGLIFSRKLYWRRIRTSQSWLCFTRQQGLTRSNVTAGSGLICGRAGREQRDGLGPTWPLRRGVAKGWVWSARVCVCVREQGWLVLFLPTEAFDSAIALFAIGLGFGFSGPAPSPPGASSRDLEM